MILQNKNIFFAFFYLFICHMLSYGNIYKKPNIVILFSDDAGYGDFGFQGSTEFSTPNLDKMREEGMLFKQGYVAGNVCHPSRVGIMLGQNPARVGHHFNSDLGLPDTAITLASQMKGAGYRTMLLGKWHIGKKYLKDHPMNEGFDEFFGHLEGSHKYFQGNLTRGLNEQVSVNGRYLTDLFAEEALSFIDRNQDNPFFLFVSFNAPHGPYESKPDVQSRFTNTYWPEVAGMTFTLDSACGLILNKLDELDLSENTLVFFLNDNGGASGHNNKPFSGMKGTVLEGGVRVPFLMKWKGVIPSNSTYQHPITSLDIFPTISALSNQKVPEDRVYDGVNLMPFILGDITERPHKYLYWSKWQDAIRYMDYKLVRDTSFRPLLYHIPSDIKEENDLTDKMPGLATALEQELDRYLLEDGISPIHVEVEKWQINSRKKYGNRLVEDDFTRIDSGIVLEPETPDPGIYTVPSKTNIPLLPNTKFQNGALYWNTPLKEKAFIQVYQLNGALIYRGTIPSNTRLIWDFHTSDKVPVSGVLHIQINQGNQVILSKKVFSPGVL